MKNLSPNIGISTENLSAVAALLNRLLADEYVLYTKTNNYHWNLLGPKFHDYHLLFEKQYRELADIVDLVAERVRALGHTSLGTLTAFLKHTRLKEQPDVIPAADEMVANLLSDHESIIRTIRQDIEATEKKHGDMGTTDFLSGIMEQHEKTAWMLRSLLM